MKYLLSGNASSYKHWKYTGRNKDKPGFKTLTCATPWNPAHILRRIHGLSGYSEDFDKEGIFFEMRCIVIAK
jgi:hypothetical protein